MKQQLKTLADLAEAEGGAVRLWFDQALEVVMADLIDRPALNKDRELNIKLLFRPVADQSGALGYTVHKVSVGSKVPGHATRAIAGRPDQGGVVWDDLSPKDPAQMTIDDEIDRAKEEGRTAD